MPIDSASLRDTLRLWGSGVSIVTTMHEDTEGHHNAGMTVSAFNSLSLDPPLILICLNKNTTTAQFVEQSGVFAVSILSDDQSALSDRFAGRIELVQHKDRFHEVPTMTAITGSPILSDALAWLDCKIHTRYDGSTHWIVVGEVLATGQRDFESAPLIYFNRGYHTTTPALPTSSER